MAQSTSTYLGLPRELCDQIHRYLAPPDLLSLYQTCRIIHIEVLPALQATYVLQLRESIDEYASINRLKSIPASIRE